MPIYIKNNGVYRVTHQFESINGVQRKVNQQYVSQDGITNLVYSEPSLKNGLIGYQLSEYDTNFGWKTILYNIQAKNITKKILTDSIIDGKSVNGYDFVEGFYCFDFDWTLTEEKSLEVLYNFLYAGNWHLRVDFDVSLETDNVTKKNNIYCSFYPLGVEYDLNGEGIIGDEWSFSSKIEQFSCITIIDANSFGKSVYTSYEFSGIRMLIGTPMSLCEGSDVMYARINSFDKFNLYLENESGETFYIGKESV